MAGLRRIDSAFVPEREIAVLRPIVFLDIDDVLCLNSAYTGFDAQYALRSSGGPYGKPIPVDLWQRLFAAAPRSNLRALHEEFVPWYVISSSWRTGFRRAEMEMVFRNTEIDFVAENLHEVWRTADHGMGRYSGNRREEIEEWVARWHHEVSPWVALDDFESGSSLAWHERAVLCDAGVGFSEDRLQQARAVLGGAGQ